MFAFWVEGLFQRYKILAGNACLFVGGTDAISHKISKAGDCEKDEGVTFPLIKHTDDGPMTETNLITSQVHPWGWGEGGVDVLARK